LNEDCTNSFYHWELLFVGLKNVLVEFQCVGDQNLKGLPFAWYYGDDVIIFFMLCTSISTSIIIIVITLTTHNIEIP
jgi:hypothetical protein